MRKFFTLLILLIISLGAKAQDASLDLEFTDPTQADKFNFIFDSGGELTKSVAGGELRLDINKKEWHFFQIWVKPFDFINNPYLSFRVKADKDLPIRIWVKQENGTEKSLYDQTLTVVKNGDNVIQWQTVNLSFENTSELNNIIQEIGMDLGGYQLPPNAFSSTVYFDHFKVGAAAKPNTALSYDFSDPSHGDKFNFIFDSGGELTKTVTGGEMKLVLNKKEWHFFQMGLGSFDFIKNPYLSFKIKPTVSTPVRIWIKQPDGGPEKELLNQTYAASTDYQTVSLKFDLTTPLTGAIGELGIDIGGYQLPPAVFSGTVFIDDFKLGAAAKPPVVVYGTGYSEDFSSAPYAGWASGEGYTVSRDGAALKFVINRSTPIKDTELTKLPSLSFDQKVLNILANPYLNMDIKGNDPFTLSVIAVDNDLRAKEHKIRVVPTGNYQTISLNLSSLPGINLSEIKKFMFDFNREGFAFRTSIFVDQIKIGNQAANLAVMDGLSHKNYAINTGASVVSKEILLTNIKNASSITAVASSATIIENVTVTAIESGKVKLKFDIKPNKTGPTTVNVTVNGAAGYSANIYSTVITIEGNLPPSLNAVADVIGKVGKKVLVALSGISDGNPTVSQVVAITAASGDASVVTISPITYDGENPTATLELNPLKAGNAKITVTLTDAGAGTNSKSVDFDVTIYNEINNAPTINAISSLEIYNDQGVSTFGLTGIGDGDNNNQSLTLTATSSNVTVVNDISVSYTSGNQATLNFNPAGLGTSNITVKVKDNGGNAENDGHDSVSISFDITVLKRPVTGYVATLQKSVEGFDGGSKYNVTEVDSAGFKALVFQCTDKDYWAGVNLNLPEEMDLSEHPYVTMEIYPISQNTIHWIWLYDANGNRNDINNREGNHIQRPVAGKWNKVVFDFSGENDWINNSTGPINNKRIESILFDMHNADFNWPPPPNYTGTFVIRNLRVGSEADIQLATTATINPVANQVVFVNKADQKVKLSGITNGKGSSSGVTVSVASSSAAVINPVISAIDAEGKATLTYSAGAATGKSTITLTVSANGSSNGVVTFDIDVLNNVAAEAATVTINKNQRFQTMRGFGTFTNNWMYNKDYTELMGGTAMRIGLIENQLEPVNDNDDPNVLNMEGLNYSAFDWNYYKDLKARGVENFILSSWSPPAWMKTSLTLDYKSAGYTKDTDGTTNRLDYDMYDEFAESIVAVVKAFKQRAGIDLLAIGLQNEPAFHEPYPSAILGFDRFALLIKIVGKRFEQEGITTKLYLAEQVSGAPDNAANFYEDNHNYLQAVQDDPESNKYAHAFAVHGYSSDGITPGQPKYEAWESYRDSAALGAYPKEVWMTETHVDYRTWEDGLGIAGAIYGALQYGNVSLWTQWAFEGQMVRQGNPTGMLYAMSNFAKFIRPGHIRVGSSTSNNDVLATSFIDPKTGDLSIVMVNKGASSIAVKLAGEGLHKDFKMYTTAENMNLVEVTNFENGVIMLPGKSVSTILIAAPLAMKDIAKVTVEAGSGTHNVQLTGIANSIGGKDNLTLAVANSNNDVVPGISIGVVQTDGTATITFTAGNNIVGTSNVTVTLSDNIGKTLVKSFQIEVVNTAPLSMNDIANETVLAGSGTHNVTVAGIKNSFGGNTGLTLAVANSNSNSVPTISVAPVQSDGTAAITYTVTDNTEGGSSTITVTLSDASGKTLVKTFVITVDKATGLDEEKLLGKVNIYPNPSKGEFYLETEKPVDRIEILDATGRTKHVDTAVDNHGQLISVKNLATGVYLLRAYNEKGESISRRIIIK